MDRLQRNADRFADLVQRMAGQPEGAYLGVALCSELLLVGSQILAHTTPTHAKHSLYVSLAEPGARREQPNGHAALVVFRELDPVCRIPLARQRQQFHVAPRLGHSGADRLGPGLAVRRPSVPSVDKLAMLVDLNRRQHFEVRRVLLHRCRRVATSSRRCSRVRCRRARLSVSACSAFSSSLIPTRTRRGQSAMPSSPHARPCERVYQFETPAVAPCSRVREVYQRANVAL